MGRVAQWHVGGEMAVAGAIHCCTTFLSLWQRPRVAFASAASVSIADTESGKIVNRLSKESNLIPFVSVAASPDGKYIAAARTQPVTITVWRSEDNEVLAEFQPPTTGNPTVAFSPDGQYMVLGSDQGFITYRTSDFSQWSLSRMDNIRDISFSPDGRFLLFPTVTSKVQMWSMATQRRVAELSHPSVMIGSGSTGFSPTGKRFFSIGGDVIRIWTMAGLPEKVVTGGHSQGVPQIAFHPRDPILASGSKDGTIRFWNSRDGSQLKMIDIQEPVESIAYSTTARCWLWGRRRSDPYLGFGKRTNLLRYQFVSSKNHLPKRVSFVLMACVSAAMASGSHSREVVVPRSGRSTETKLRIRFRLVELAYQRSTANLRYSIPRHASWR